MYSNLLEIMKAEEITFWQIAELLKCRYQTVRDIVNGERKRGFYYDDACKIQKKFFPEYDVAYIFKRI